MHNSIATTKYKGSQTIKQLHDRGGEFFSIKLYMYMKDWKRTVKNM